MLGGAEIQNTILSVLLLIIVEIPIFIHCEGQSLLQYLVHPLLGFLYVLVVYSLFNRAAWSRSITIIVSSFSTVYGFLIIGSILLEIVSSTHNNGTTAFATASIVSMSVYRLVIALLMIFVILYLRKLDTRNWFVCPHKEKHVESHVSLTVQNRIFSITTLFLMLGGAEIQSTILYFPFRFPVQIEMPGPMHSEAQQAVFQSLIYSLAKGFLYLLVVSGLFKRAAWARSVTTVVSSCSIVYGFLIFVGVLIMASSFHAGTTDFAMASEVSMGVYGLAIVILMIFVIRYLQKPAVKDWFASLQKEETHESSSS